MISKKEALTLGVLVIGGVGLATMVNNSGGSGGGKAKPRFGTILGTHQGVSQPPGSAGTMYNIKQADVSFPDPPKYDLSAFFQQLLTPPSREPSIGRGAAGVSSAGKDYSIQTKKGMILSREGIASELPAKDVPFLTRAERVILGYESYRSPGKKTYSRTYSTKKSSASTSGRASDKSVRKARATAKSAVASVHHTAVISRIRSSSRTSGSAHGSKKKTSSLGFRSKSTPRSRAVAARTKRMNEK